MKLKLFSTERQIREWLNNKDNTILDKHLTIGEFLNNIIVVKNRKFIDKDIRKIYLFKAIEKLDIEKLGFKKEFLSFAKNSEFIFSFFKELFLERVDIDDVIISDTYIEYEEHLKLLKEIKNNYEKLLEEDGYIDEFLINEYEINEKLLEGIKEIEINLDGYLSKFDVEVLKKLKKKIIINVEISRFNRSLIRKFLTDLDDGYKYKIDFNTNEILEKEIIKSDSKIEVSHFSKRFDEINFVFAKIAEFVESGIDADKIVVILPDESFAEFLEEFDEFKNLNFAMGKSFTESNLFIKLESLYSYLTNEDEISFLKINDILEKYQNENLIEFIKSLATNKELELIDETLFKMQAFENMFEDKKLFLHFILERLKELRFDDIYSGKVTVMGVLESRGIEFEGVILVDFNEDIVPNVNSKDLFLNSAIRKKAKLPTRSDKENLQKHYYYSLINHAKKVAISYVQNEKDVESRFIYELGIELGENQDEKYNEVLYNFSNPKNIAHYDDEFEIKTPLYPTTLKTLLECPKKYYFSKILKIENDEIQEENFGSVFHKAVENAVKNKDKINSENDYFEFIMNEIYQKMNSRKDIYKIRVEFEDSIKKFCKQDFENMKYSKNLCEENVNFYFEGLSLGARIDRIDINEKSITLIDYKTSKNLKTDDVYDFQLTFYYLYALEKYLNKTIKTAYWDIHKAKFLEVPLRIEELKEILQNLPRKVRVAEDIIIKDKVVKKASDICKYCDYKLACKGEL
jgi:ATP-dependent helicase/nuclease subunit B